MMDLKRHIMTTLLPVVLCGPLGAWAASPAPMPAQPVLRVCADPNNLPFSNATGEGFENRLAQMVAETMGATVEYTWWAQRRGFIRNTLEAGLCDVVMGVPSRYEMARTTRPYYRSSYVFLYRADRHYRLHSLDDARLATLKLGVHLVGNDNPPPAVMLAQRGIINNVMGYSLYGDYRDPNPPARLIDAVDSGDVDVAIAWGPLAGYFAQRARHALTMVPIDQPGGAALPLRFAISVGVRKDDAALQARLDAALLQKRSQIDALLKEYGVPLADMPGRPDKTASMKP
jgi:mxaJ protein